MVNIFGAESVFENIVEVLPVDEAMGMLNKIFKDVRIYSQSGIGAPWATDISHGEAAEMLNMSGYHYSPDDVYSPDEIAYAAIVEIRDVSPATDTAKVGIMIYQRSYDDNE